MIIFNVYVTKLPYQYKVLDFYSEFTDIFYAVKIESYGYQ